MKNAKTNANNGASRALIIMYCLLANLLRMSLLKKILSCLNFEGIEKVDLGVPIL